MLKPYPKDFREEVVRVARDREPGVRIKGVALKYEGLPFRWDPARRQALRAEVDAAVFHLFDLVRDEVEHVLDSFWFVADRDRGDCGAYRTKRLILERYDAMATAAEAGTEYQTVLDPPLADPGVAHPAASRPIWAVTGDVRTPGRLS